MNNHPDYEDYIPISIINEIRLALNLSGDKKGDKILVITKKGSWYTDEPFTINSNGITGKFFNAT